MKQVHFYMPAGEINPLGNGASKRSAQINDLLSANFNLKNVNKISGTFFPRFKRYSNALSVCIRHQIPINTFREFSELGHHYLNCKKTTGDYKNNKGCFFWESTTNNYYYKPNFFKEFGFKLIAFPHNLESLVPGQSSPFSKLQSPDWLQEELDQLKLCDHVFTISEEEQWFLSLNNIKSTYYPYFPTQIQYNNLLKIRIERQKLDQGGFYLMFGSFFYQPIGTGLLQILKPLNTTDSQIIISGFGSENIIGSIDFKLNSNIKIIGSTSTTELNDLLVRCKGVIVNQSGSSGALTKLKELQIAGVPVILNSESTRSFKNIHGFHVFHDFEELKVLLNKNLSMPDLPEANSFYENRVIEIINSLQ